MLEFIYKAIYRTVVFFWVMDTFITIMLSLTFIISFLVGAWDLVDINLLAIFGFYLYWFFGMFFIMYVEPPEIKFRKIDREER